MSDMSILIFVLMDVAILITMLGACFQKKFPLSMRIGCLVIAGRQRSAKGSNPNQGRQPPAAPPGSWLLTDHTLPLIPYSTADWLPKNKSADNVILGTYWLLRWNPLRVMSISRNCRIAAGKAVSRKFAP